MHVLTEKDKTFVWSPECNIAFQLLKNALISCPILAYPTSEDYLILDTDASNSMAWVLCKAKYKMEKRKLFHTSQGAFQDQKEIIV